ncbi:hypothetical protein HFO94_27635 [Rhizobium leguminosarum]|uniref:hypothetical protein n=1 Tax=Rhizobium leguminosarum TaxID=384 RepID=UPI001C9772C1|nr:hypothetical protein [Rhizobium leguminosarum]MBY5357254.1 hypothetical protein [Rhizobium leguminosarum]
MSVDHRMLSVIISLCLLGSSAQANAPSECDAVLKTELQRTDVNTSTRLQATRNYVCSHSFNEFNDSYGGNAAGAYGAISGSAAYNQTNYKKFQQDSCSDASSIDFQSGFAFTVLRDASPGAIDAWKVCVQHYTTDFSCWAEPEPDSPDIALVINQPNPEPFKIADAVLSENASFADASLMAPETPIKFGENRIILHRTDQTLPVSFTLNITSPYRAKSCHVTIPAKFTPPGPPIIELRMAGSIKYILPNGHCCRRKWVDEILTDYNKEIIAPGRVRDFDLTFTQFTNGRRCATGAIAPGALNFPAGTTMDSTPEFRSVFQGGGQSASHGRLIQIFIDPKVCPPFLGGN